MLLAGSGLCAGRRRGSPKDIKGSPNYVEDHLEGDLLDRVGVAPDDVEYDVKDDFEVGDDGEELPADGGPRRCQRRERLSARLRTGLEPP